MRVNMSNKPLSETTPKTRAKSGSFPEDGISPLDDEDSLRRGTRSVDHSSESFFRRLDDKRSRVHESSIEPNDQGFTHAQQEGLVSLSLSLAAFRGEGTTAINDLALAQATGVSPLVAANSSLWGTERTTSSDDSSDSRGVSQRFAVNGNRKGLDARSIKQGLSAPILRASGVLPMTQQGLREKQERTSLANVTALTAKLQAGKSTAVGGSPQRRLREESEAAGGITVGLMTAGSSDSTRVLARRHSEDVTKSGRKRSFSDLETDAMPDLGSGNPRRLTFPEKLMEILNHEAHREIIYWLPDGDAFAFDPSRVAREIIPIHFGPTKFESFTRKLNRWGFKRYCSLDAPNDAFVYAHPLFKRDFPNLLAKMSGTKRIPVESDEDVRRFHKLLHLYPRAIQHQPKGPEGQPVPPGYGRDGPVANTTTVPSPLDAAGPLLIPGAAGLPTSAVSLAVGRSTSLPSSHQQQQTQMDPYATSLSRMSRNNETIDLTAEKGVLRIDESAAQRRNEQRARLERQRQQDAAKQRREAELFGIPPSGKRDRRSHTVLPTVDQVTVGVAAPPQAVLHQPSLQQQQQQQQEQQLALALQQQQQLATTRGAAYPVAGTAAVLPGAAATAVIPAGAALLPGATVLPAMARTPAHFLPASLAHAQPTILPQHAYAFPHIQVVDSVVAARRQQEAARLIGATSAAPVVFENERALRVQNQMLMNALAEQQKQLDAAKRQNRRFDQEL